RQGERDLRSDFLASRRAMSSTCGARAMIDWEEGLVRAPTSDSMRSISAGSTHVGYKRSHNADFYSCDDRLGLYIVADGVGGHAKGEIASREAVEELVMWVRRHL